MLTVQLRCVGSGKTITGKARTNDPRVAVYRVADKYFRAMGTPASGLCRFEHFHAADTYRVQFTHKTILDLSPVYIAVVTWPIPPPTKG